MALLWSQITISIIEITLKQLLHKKYGWNNPNWGRLGLKSPKLHFLFWQLKIHRIYKKFKCMSRAQFSLELDFFFEMLVTMSSITINSNWNFQKIPKTANLKSTISFNVNFVLAFHQYNGYNFLHCFLVMMGTDLKC